MKHYSPVCVDASLVFRLFMFKPGTKQDANALWRQWRSEGRQIIAPALIFYEITNALYQYVRQGLFTRDEAQQILNHLDDLEIELFENPALHQQAIALAQTLELKATYDAHYLALAQQMQAEFWTADARLVKKMENTFAWVRLL